MSLMPNEIIIFHERFFVKCQTLHKMVEYDGVSIEIFNF